MSSRFGKGIWVHAAAIAIAAIAAASWPSNSTASAAPRICIDVSSPTAGLDQSVAREAAHKLGTIPRLVTYDGSAGVSEGFFRFLLQTRCDIVMGFPVDRQEPDVPAGLAVTRGYFQTEYVLASLHKARTVTSLPHNATVAVQLGTVPNFYLVGALGPKPSAQADVYNSQEEALAALSNGKDTSAMVWLPSVVLYETRHHRRPQMFLTVLPIPHNRFDLAALYDAGHSDFAKQFDAVVRPVREHLP